MTSKDKGIDADLEKVAEALWNAEFLIVVLGPNFDDGARTPYSSEFCDPRLVAKPNKFMGFWGALFNEYNERLPHEGFGILARWRDKLFSLGDVRKRQKKKPSDEESDLDRLPRCGVFSALLSALPQKAGLPTEEILEPCGNIFEWQCAAVPACSSRLTRVDRAFRFHIDEATNEALPVKYVKDRREIKPIDTLPVLIDADEEAKFIEGEQVKNLELKMPAEEKARRLSRRMHAATVHKLSLALQIGAERFADGFTGFARHSGEAVHMVSFANAPAPLSDIPNSPFAPRRSSDEEEKKKKEKEKEREKDPTQPPRRAPPPPPPVTPFCPPQRCSHMLAHVSAIDLDMYPSKVGVFFPSDPVKWSQERKQFYQHVTLQQLFVPDAPQLCAERQQNIRYNISVAIAHVVSKSEYDDANAVAGRNKNGTRGSSPTQQRSPTALMSDGARSDASGGGVRCAVGMPDLALPSGGGGGGMTSSRSQTQLMSNRSGGHRTPRTTKFIGEAEVTGGEADGDLLRPSSSSVRRPGSGPGSGSVKDRSSGGMESPTRRGGEDPSRPAPRRGQRSAGGASPRPHSPSSSPRRQHRHKNDMDPLALAASADALFRPVLTEELREKLMAVYPPPPPPPPPQMSTGPRKKQHEQVTVLGAVAPEPKQTSRPGSARQRRGSVGSAVPAAATQGPTAGVLLPVSTTATTVTGELLDPALRDAMHQQRNLVNPKYTDPFGTENAERSDLPGSGGTEVLFLSHIPPRETMQEPITFQYHDVVRVPCPVDDDDIPTLLLPPAGAKISIVCETALGPTPAQVAAMNAPRPPVYGEDPNKPPAIQQNPHTYTSHAWQLVGTVLPSSFSSSSPTGGGGSPAGGGGNAGGGGVGFDQQRQTFEYILETKNRYVVKLGVTKQYPDRISYLELEVPCAEMLPTVNIGAGLGVGVPGQHSNNNVNPHHSSSSAQQAASAMGANASPNPYYSKSTSGGGYGGGGGHEKDKKVTGATPPVSALGPLYVSRCSDVAAVHPSIGLSSPPPNEMMTQLRQSSTLNSPNGEVKPPVPAPNHILCTACHGIARPFILMNKPGQKDDTFCAPAMAARLKLWKAWEKQMLDAMRSDNNKALVILELGCDRRMDPARAYSEKTFKSLKAMKTTFVRVAPQPLDPKAKKQEPPPNFVTLEMAPQLALGSIDRLVQEKIKKRT